MLHGEVLYENDAQSCRIQPDLVELGFVWRLRASDRLTIRTTLLLSLPLPLPLRCSDGWHHVYGPQVIVPLVPGGAESVVPDYSAFAAQTLLQKIDLVRTMSLGRSASQTVIA